MTPYFCVHFHSYLFPFIIPEHRGYYWITTTEAGFSTVHCARTSMSRSGALWIFCIFWQQDWPQGGNIVGTSVISSAVFRYRSLVFRVLIFSSQLVEPVFTDWVSVSSNYMFRCLFFQEHYPFTVLKSLGCNFTSLPCPDCWGSMNVQL